jgi:hypothetical protein
MDDYMFSSEGQLILQCARQILTEAIKKFPGVSLPRFTIPMLVAAGQQFSKEFERRDIKV